MDIRELFDRAAARTGSHSATARDLGVTPNRVFSWRAGKVGCPLHIQAKVCALAELGAAASWDHIKEAAGVQIKEAVTTTAAFVLLLAGCAGIVGATPAEARASDLLPDNVYYVN